ncbi:MAG: flagellin [Vicinamibacterales bacterium]
MRIISEVYREGLAAINQAADRLSNAERQLSSGRRVNAASEDPRGVQQAIGAHGSLARVDAYTATGNSASARLAAADSALASFVDKLTSALSTAHGARGSSATATTRAAAATEIRALRDGLASDLNVSFDGTYLFSGSRTTDPAWVNSGSGWTYQGDASPVQVEVDRGRLVSVSFDGQAIAQGTDPEDVFTVLDNLAASIEAGDDAAVTTGIDALERAFDRAAVTQGRLGAAERTVEDTSLRLSAVRVAAESRRSKLEDTDLAGAITALNQADTAYRGALGAVSSAERQSLLDYLR